MEYRNIFLANPARLSVQREQLVIEQAEKIIAGKHGFPGFFMEIG